MIRHRGAGEERSRSRRRGQRRTALVVSVTDAIGRRLRSGGLESWLAGVAPGSARGRVNVALVTDGRIRGLNRRYRGIDRATDVLSFPMPPERDGHSGPALLGDIVIATGVARRRAARLGHSFRDELRVLALHGLLHLLGYDHERDGGEMRRLEDRLRMKGGLASGLIGRTTTRGAA
jgi:probable rRNA maturation factor